MKKTIMIAVLAMVLFSACGKKEEKVVKANQSRTIVAKKEISIEGSPIRLPVGTKVTPSSDGYELQVELPEGYFFLTENTIPVNIEQQGKWPLLAYVIASYKCKCSASDGSACQVWYQEDAGGFGCIHKSCSGSCTGSFTTLQQAKVSGVLNQFNGDVSARIDRVYRPASLTSQGFEDFFSKREVQEKIAQQYELLYKNEVRPDFKNMETNTTIASNYVYLKARLYGVSFYMMAPKEITSLNKAVEAFATESATCSCDNRNGKCKKKSKGFLGWDVYWCEGDCNACVLTVTDKLYAD